MCCSTAQDVRNVSLPPQLPAPVQIGIVETITHYRILSKAGYKAFEALVTICAVARLRMYGMYRSRHNFPRLFRSELLRRLPTIGFCRRLATKLSRRSLRYVL